MKPDCWPLSCFFMTMQVPRPRFFLEPIKTNQSITNYTNQCGYQMFLAFLIILSGKLKKWQEKVAAHVPCMAKEPVSSCPKLIVSNGPRIAEICSKVKYWLYICNCYPHHIPTISPLPSPKNLRRRWKRPMLHAGSLPNPNLWQGLCLLVINPRCHRRCMVDHYIALY